jgi:hypothetical protein
MSSIFFFQILSSYNQNQSTANTIIGKLTLRYVCYNLSLQISSKHYRYTYTDSSINVGKQTLHNRETNLAMGSSDWTCKYESCRTTFPLRPVDGPPRMAAS